MTAPIVVDFEFSTWLPPLSADERRELTESLISEGCRDPLIVWPDGGKHIIVDGHNRYSICTRHDIEFQIVEKKFESRDAVIDWITVNQLSRRNLDKDARDLIIGKRYERLKTKRGGDKKSIRQDGGLFPDTAKRVAKEANVSTRTVERAAKFARSVETIKKNVGKEAADNLFNRVKRIKHADVAKLAEVSKSKPDDVRAAIAGEKAVSKVTGTARPFAIPGPKPSPTTGEVLNQRELQGLVWALGIKTLAACDGMSEAKARRFIGMLIQESKGREEVTAAAIAMTAWKSPVQAASWMRAVHQKLLNLAFEKRRGKDNGRIQTDQESSQGNKTNGFGGVKKPPVANKA